MSSHSTKPQILDAGATFFPHTGRLGAERDRKKCSGDKGQGGGNIREKKKWDAVDVASVVSTRSLLIIEQIAVDEIREEGIYLVKRKKCIN